jgi:hypothetical protein
MSKEMEVGKKKKKREKERWTCLGLGELNN